MPEVVFATDHLVVINKPAGLLSVPGKGPKNQDCVPARARLMFPHATGPITVHRLDMDTSGLLVIALDPDTQRELSRQFEEREVDKSYTALVEGTLAPESGTIDAPIRPDLSRRPHQVIDPTHHRPAITRFKVLGFEPGRTRLELTPLTGRTHQLRVHAAYAGHPIVGDVLYGHDERNAPRLMLHASMLAFTEPATGCRAAFRSTPPF
ncbi:MAG: RluA family pseudouridine synthase [Phycisphaerales bacterium]|nr:RluA family pseudouridine synthase [Phycisphaerales bacterium]